MMNTVGDDIKTARRQRAFIAGVVAVPVMLSAAFILKPSDEVQINQAAQAGGSSGEGRESVDKNPGGDLFEETRRKLDACLAKQGAPKLGAHSSDQDRKLFALMKQRCSVEQNLRNFKLMIDFEKSQPKSRGRSEANEASRVQAENFAQAARKELEHVDASILAVRDGKSLPKIPSPMEGSSATRRLNNSNAVPNPENTKSELNRYHDKAFSECMLRYGHSVASVDDFKRRYLDPIAGPGANAITATTPEMKRILDQYLKCSRESSEATMKKQNEGMP